MPDYTHNGPIYFSGSNLSDIRACPQLNHETKSEIDFCQSMEILQRI